MLRTEVCNNGNEYFTTTVRIPLALKRQIDQIGDINLSRVITDRLTEIVIQRNRDENKAY